MAEEGRHVWRVSIVSVSIVVSAPATDCPNLTNTNTTRYPTDARATILVYFNDSKCLANDNGPAIISAAVTHTTLLSKIGYSKISSSAGRKST